nr:unnamed protein product [Callosobruchus chinensis]
MPYHHNFEESEDATPEPPRNKCLACLKANTLTIATVTGVVIGAIVGIVLRNTRDSWPEREIMYIASLVSAIASLDLSLSGKIAARAIAYYLTTTFAAVVLGMVLVVAIKPGVGHAQKNQTLVVDSRNITTYRTKLIPTTDNQTDIFEFKIGTEVVQNTNILGLVVAAAAVGIAIAQVGEEAQAIGNFFHGLMAVSMKITNWVYSYHQDGRHGFSDELLGVVFCNRLFRIAHTRVRRIAFLYFALTRKNPATFVHNMGQAIATAFGTASSSATLPVTIRCLEDNLGVDRRVARFALPIGATINMDGTALYEAVAAIFIAQQLALGCWYTSGWLGYHGHGIGYCGLPAGDVSLILAVDWLLSMKELGLLNTSTSDISSATEATKLNKEQKKNGKRKDKDQDTTVEMSRF